MDFPAYNLTPVPITDEMVAAMGVRPVEAYVARDLLCVFEHEDDVITMNPDQEKVKALGGLLLNVTAPGTKFDCVSRSFAPKCNIAEDPVCGSGHCHVIPYWAQRLNKDKLVARQASARGGTLYCEVCGERIKIAGRAVIYAIAELYVE
jgi:predicted PhzF superfamily epimerase YddE/YHI9